MNKWTSLLQYGENIDGVAEEKAFLAEAFFCEFTLLYLIYLVVMKTVFAFEHWVYKFVSLNIYHQ